MGFRKDLHGTEVDNQLQIFSLYSSEIVFRKITIFFTKGIFKNDCHFQKVVKIIRILYILIIKACEKKYEVF